MLDDIDRHSSNDSENRQFTDVLDHHLTRRTVVGGSVAAAAVAFLVPGTARGEVAHRHPTVAPAGGVTVPPAGRPLLGFESVPANDADAVTVPPGYVAEVLIPWGTPLRSDGPRWRRDASNTAADQARQVGSHHDGMHLFPLPGWRHGPRAGLLAVNHEYVDPDLLTTDGITPPTPEKVDKALAAHGVTIVAIRQGRDGRWRHLDSRHNRRVTGTTPVTFSGPVTSRHPALQANNPPMGTLNNCANGHTPWGTYLTCEENWNTYFGTTNSGHQLTAEEQRYGVTREGAGYRWHEASPRFDIAVNPNEPNRFGWVVEIDPMNPRSTPVKRTALGRFKHEGACVTQSRGRIVVYLGDDQDKEYIYKFVGDRPWRALLARGRSPLDHGRLYVARFEDDGTGVWLPLVFGEGPLTRANGWADQADVLLRTRRAADAVGATKMDRPEWIAEHPRTGQIYVTLTNGSSGVTAANPRKPNPYGHIIRWSERGGDNTGTRFDWDVFVLAGDPAYDPAVTIKGDIFGSPDGLAFDRSGRMWIQTDVSNSSQNLASKGYDRIKNNQMLVADPDTGEIRRFLVGPRGCEITGVAMAPDQRSLFVNVQHPGEETTAWGTPTPDNPRAVSNWPDFHPAGRPRSATVVIRRRDGGVVGT